MGKIIGIDLGTTNSAVAILEGKEPKIIPNSEGNRTTPSIVAFDDKNNILVGLVAKRQAIVNPENTIYSIKRYIGKKFSDISDQFKNVAYKLDKAPNGDINVSVKGELKSAQEISAFVLQKLKRDAEAYLGEEVTEAVITVPAYFNDSQRQATKDAGRIAGLEVKRIVNEPTAAALAYGLDKQKNELIAVYDFGGGTFDISILEIGDNVVEVISTNGDTYLGGDNIDERIMEYLIDEFKKDTGINIAEDRMALQRLKDAAEKAKIELSSAQETEINLPFLTAVNGAPKHMQLKLTRAKFQTLIEDIVEKTFEPCKKALKDASKKASDINEIILVGGSTRIPLVIEKVTEFFNKKPHQGVNPDEVVALGAAVQAGVLSGDVKDILLLDVTPLSLGVETLGGVTTTLIPRNTTIPKKKSEVFTTAADNQNSVVIHVLQGERQFAKDNKSLGQFILDGIPPAPRGVPQIEVTFDINANGILTVSASDKMTKKEQHITIQASGGLDDNEVEKLIKEAKKHEAEDKKQRQEVDKRNEADSFIFQTEKAFKENRDKLNEAEQKDLDGAIEAAKGAVKNGKIEDITKAVDKLKEVAYKLSSKLYQQTAPGTGGAQAGGAPTAGGAQPNNAPADDDVIDAEYES